MRLNKDVTRINNYNIYGECENESKTFKKGTQVDSIKKLSGQFSNFIYASIGTDGLYISLDDVS